MNVNTGGINYEGPTAPAKLYMKVGEDDGGASLLIVHLFQIIERKNIII